MPFGPWVGVAVASGHIFAGSSLHHFGCWEPGGFIKGLGTGRAVLPGENILPLSQQLICSPNQNKLSISKRPLALPLQRSLLLEASADVAVPAFGCLECLDCD